MEHAKSRALDIESLQKKPEQIRNICVLAHVDHDNREDEQERLITMKSSSISLIYKPVNEPENYLINLIDSPGHVDFSFEVSSALRLSDGGIVLVDALESVCQQTVTVIRQAWEERVRMVLVINKIDRLPFHLSTDSMDAHNHIKGIIHTVNAEISALITAQINMMIAADPNIAKKKEELVSKLEEKYYFAPEKGNVAFGSSLDCWALTVDTYSELIAPKLGIDKELIKKHLWGDFYFSPKDKAFYPITPETTGKKSCFALLVLEPIMNEYMKLMPLKQSTDTAKYNETRNKIKDKLSKQMPLDICILRLVAKHLPSPKTAQKNRLSVLCPELYSENSIKNPELMKIRTSIENVDNSPDAPIIVYVSKMMAIDKVQISDLKDTFLAEMEAKNPSDRLALIAFSRVFSGTLSKGKSVFVMGPKHNREKGVIDIHEITIEHLYTFMGMHLNVADVIFAGCVCGIGGLDKLLYKVGTVSSNPNCPSFTAVRNKSKPIVKVAIEAEKLSDMEKLTEGLQKLNRAEPSVEIYLTESGEHILCACGEVHLQKCVKDLKDEYAKVNFKVSEHIVNFRETILLKYIKPEKIEVKPKEPEKPAEPILVSKIDFYIPTEEEKKKLEEEKAKKMKDEEEKKSVISSDKTNELYLEKLRSLKTDKQKGIAFDITPNGRARFYIRAIGLEFNVTKWLESKRQILKKIAGKQLEKGELEEFIKEFKQQLEVNATPKKITNLILNYLLSFGPKRTGPNMVISPYLTNEQSLLYSPLVATPGALKYHKKIPEGILQFISLEDLHKAIISGFELATMSGPLCEERMIGACFMIEAIEYIELKLEFDTYGPFAGQIMSTTRDLCRRAFINADPRIVEGLYMCTMQVSSATLGKIYSVIHKRRGKVVSEELLPETDVFTVRVLIPVMESFGFAEEIREKGEGITDPQMTFSHWEIIHADPFFVAKTAKEYEEYGDQAQAPNLAKIIIEKVRKRKGLPIEAKLVTGADKQRTMTKMKQLNKRRQNI